MNNLYFVANRGCDASTYGITTVSDEDFPKFKAFIENLNKNSYYGCMPTISVYKIDWSDLKEAIINPDAEFWDDDYVDKDERFYYDGKIYTFAEKYFNWYNLECVICGD